MSVFIIHTQYIIALITDSVEITSIHYIFKKIIYVRRNLIVCKITPDRINLNRIITMQA